MIPMRHDGFSIYEYFADSDNDCVKELKEKLLRFIESAPGSRRVDIVISV